MSNYNSRAKLALSSVLPFKKDSIKIANNTNIDVSPYFSLFFVRCFIFGCDLSFQRLTFRGCKRAKLICSFRSMNDWNKGSALGRTKNKYHCQLIRYSCKWGVVFALQNRLLNHQFSFADPHDQPTPPASSGNSLSLRPHPLLSKSVQSACQNCLILELSLIHVQYLINDSNR
jgi:hypothetical protein